MKMPNNQSAENGLYDYEETSYYSETIENGVEEFNSTPENDFSEYLWMENEEEFDKEVMQKLEEEALMEQCIEAMLDDESQEETTNNHPSGPPDSINDVSNLINNLQLDCAEIVKGSNLNPLAAEFVPGGTHETSDNVHDSS